MCVCVCVCVCVSVCVCVCVCASICLVRDSFTVHLHRAPIFELKGCWHFQRTTGLSHRCLGLITPQTCAVLCCMHRRRSRGDGGGGGRPTPTVCAPHTHEKKKK